MPSQAPFKDHFSRQSRSYAAARPHYPEALFDWLAAQSPGHQLVWEAGCGSGQATAGLASRFARVHACDPSAAQLAQAPGSSNVDWTCAPAERCALGNASVDLACAAQAAHWFDLPAYYAEVTRVLRPGGLLAVWAYGLHRVEPAVDALLQHLYDSVLGPYWPPERALIENGYNQLPFPSPRLEVPEFEIRLSWHLDHYLDYLRSWSAVVRYEAAQGSNPVDEVAADFKRAWGDGERQVCWPVHMLAARIA